MTVVALSHGYPPIWNMGGEVSLHRSLVAVKDKKIVLTSTKKDYSFEGVDVKQIDTPDVLDIQANPKPIARQLEDFSASVVIGQNELSLAAVNSGNIVGAVSIVNVHTPPKYGRNIRQAVINADYAIYNTHVAANQWGEPDAMVLHPPITPLPNNVKPSGDAYTILSSLRNKGVEVVIELAKLLPKQRFIIVRSPAEPTHGIANFEEIVSKIPNIELHPRVSPEEVYKYLEQTRILLVPSLYETYGMSAIEAAGYGIPSIHVDTPHVREGIGKAAVLVRPLSLEDSLEAIRAIESDYEAYSERSRLRAEFIWNRQIQELEDFSNFIANVKKPPANPTRQHAVAKASRMNRHAS